VYITSQNVILQPLMIDLCVQCSNKKLILKSEMNNQNVGLIFAVAV
jgi:hypothetical protein